MDSIGQIGKYDLLKKLATGGMAEIFLARQTGVQGFEKLVVIKKILPVLARMDRFVQMFLNEARLAARFNHPNIAQIYDLGVDGDIFFIAMEFVHGQDIKAIVRRCANVRSRIPVEHIVKVFSGVLDGLHYAHTQTELDGRPAGVVHRDVSPHNIIVSFQGGVKLVDFGIAKARSQISTTAPGRVKGKHAYMSPEQCQGLDLDSRSDIFSVGIVMYELLTWSRLFKRKHDIETLKAITTMEIRDPRQLNPDLDPDLAAVVMKALQRQRDRRYQNAQEMQVALEEYLVNKGLKSNSVLISRFMAELFAEKLAGMDRALQKAQVANLESAVLAAQSNTPDLVGFLNMFFGDSTSAGDSTFSGPGLQALGPDLTPSTDFTPDLGPVSAILIPPRSTEKPPMSKEPNPSRPPVPRPLPPSAPPPKPPNGMDVLHLISGPESPAPEKSTTKEDEQPSPAPLRETIDPDVPFVTCPPILDEPPNPEPDFCPENPDGIAEDGFLDDDPFRSKTKKGRGLVVVVTIGLLVVVGVLLIVLLGRGDVSTLAKGLVKVNSIPPKAQVYLDDILQTRQTPLELDLKPGEEHTLRVEIPEYPTWEQKFTVTDVTKPLEFTAVFDKDAAEKAQMAGAPIIAEAQGRGQGSIRVESNPQGALIYLDGISTERRTPFVLRNVAAELEHAILVELEGKDAAFERLKLAAGQEAKMLLTLKDGGSATNARTTVRIESDPEGAKVIVNEWPLSKPTPVPVQLLIGAPSEVTVDLPGHRKWTKTVRPIPGVELTFVAKLKKK